jgi:outer membrane protein assembly factor BamB
MKNIRILLLILCACFVSVAWGKQLTCPADTPWGQFHRHNMQRWNPCENVLNVNNVGSLHRKWNFPTGNAVYSSPVVADGVAYIGSSDSNLYALKTGTGAKLWSYATGGTVLSSPAVANGAVHFGSFDSNVYALNASTGAKVWSYATGGSVYCSPAVANGVVYVGSWDHNMYALNASTGALLWSYPTGGQCCSSPAVANGRVFAGSTIDCVMPTQVGEFRSKRTVRFSPGAVTPGKRKES